ncbi:MAG: hypothetical protein ABL998_23730 [Planctomycetota bacterium]
MIFSLFCFLVLAAFLVCLGLFALAVTKVVAPDGKGHARGFVGGCAAMVALFLLCFLGIVGLAATIFAMGVGNIPGWNPIERIEILDDHEHHDDERWTSSTRATDESPRLPRRSIFARFTVRGDAGGELSDLLGRVVQLDLERMDDSLSVERRTEPDGSEVAIYEFRLPVREDELERFEENLRRELDGLRLKLPAGVVIEFDGSETR